MNGAVDTADPLNQKIGFELHDENIVFVIKI